MKMKPLSSYRAHHRQEATRGKKGHSEPVQTGASWTGYSLGNSRTKGQAHSGGFREKGSGKEAHRKPSVFIS